MQLKNVINTFKKYQRQIVCLLFLFVVYLLTIYQLTPNKPSYTSYISGYLALILLNFIIVLACVWYVKNFKFNSRYVFLGIVEIILFASTLALYYGYVSPVTISSVFPRKELYIIIHFLGLFLFFLTFEKNLKISKESQNNKLRFDASLLLLLAVPILNYWINNQDCFTLIYTVKFFSILGLLPFLMLLLGRILQKRYLPNNLLVPAIMGSFFVYYSMPIITNIFKQITEKNIILHIITLFFSLFFFIYLYLKQKKILRIIVIVAIISSLPTLLFGFLNQKHKNQPIINDKLPQFLSKKLTSKPDIYFLVYDSYVGTALMKYYGINNNKQIQYLKSQGFSLHENLYSLYSRSAKSIASTLNMSHPKINLYAIIVGESVVNKFLQKEGYKTHYLLSPYFLNGAGSFKGDFSYPAVDIKKSYGIDLMLNSIARGEFKFDVIYEGYDRNELRTIKREIFTKKTDYPKFVYTHSNLPGHSQDSGACLTDEVDRYKRKLQWANIEMKKDIEAILSSNRDAIIIVAGDHGPYLTGDCTNLLNYNLEEITGIHLADRFGVMLAIRWPDAMVNEYENLDILQDVFFSVFSYLYKDKSILSHKIKNKSTSSVTKFTTSSKGIIEDGKIIVGKDAGKYLYESF